MGERLFSAKQIKELVGKVAEDILSEHSDLANVALIGIRTGGIYLAQRLQKVFEEASGKPVPLGILDINLYRDDFDLGDRQPEVRQSEIGFPVEGKMILLVDDVLFTGRTVRAALEAINDYGRPSAVRLAVLIDRGHRELPIEADYVGTKIKTTTQERIKVSFSEAGDEDKVERIERPSG